MRLAVIGTGRIVQEALEAMRPVEGMECTAIFGRPHSRDKAQAIAGKFGIGAVYTDYDALLASPDIDFVYIGLVNSAHYSYAKKALQAGKHVILEKPFCSTLAEAEELVRLAEEKGLYLFEAVTLFYQPNYALVRKALSSIGRIRLVISNYSQYSSRYDAYREKKVAPAFDPALSGGCLFDINIYNLNFVIGLFGVPKDIRYAANLGFNGIDTSGIAELRYEDFQAVCIGAKDSECRSSVIIQGENGSIYVPGPPSIVSAVELMVMGEKRNLQKNMYEHRMTAEFQAFADSFARGERAAMQQGMQRSLQVMAAAEKARRSAGIAFAADI